MGKLILDLVTGDAEWADFMRMKMPGHTTLWGPEHFIKCLRQTGLAFARSGTMLSANEMEGAARMMWKLWLAADPQGAKAAKPRLFHHGEDNGTE